jgi:hypothetical protein
MPMRKMLHAVICETEGCDFKFEEITLMPSDKWYDASEHDVEMNHEVRLVHAAV